MTDRPQAADNAVQTDTLTPGTHFGPYEVLAAAGRGGMGSVHVVRDVRTGAVGALKVLHHLGEDPSRRTRFRREFRALSRLNHPNVLKVEESGIQDGRPWFTMELVEGIDLREAITTWMSDPPDVRFGHVRSTLVQITRALSYIHERGFVHRDVSPGNIMIRPDGLVKLMDFGLVTDRAAEATTSGEIVGTVAHIAPEQLRGDPVDARADLYALGTVLYQMLTGRKPFAAHTVQGWVERHLNERPRPPSELEPLVPELLDRICMRLLEKEPSARFASAMHLLQVLGDGDPATNPERWPPRSIGRTQVKAWLRSALDEAEAGRRGGALMLSGPSGCGKTRMLDLAAQAARRRGLRVLRGRCRAHDRPFGPFHSLWRELRSNTPPAVLVEAFEGNGGPTERYPIIAAFRDLIVQEAPCLILLDQVERADAATLELVEYLVRNTLELDEVPMVFVLGHEAPTPEVRSPLVTSLAVLEHEYLGPLTRSEVEELVLSVLPDDEATETLARRIFDETEGSPAYVADMLRGLVDRGILAQEDGQWRIVVDPEALAVADLPLPARLRTLLQERLAPLSPDALEVGRMLAVARRPLDLDTLIEASELEEDRVMTALDALVDAGVVVETRRGDSELAELSHARFRDVLLHDATAEEVQARHRRLGTVLERQHRYALGEVVEALAYHFEHGGVAGKAYAYLGDAGLSYLQRGLFEAGLTTLDRALAMEEKARDDLPLGQAERRLAELRLGRARALYHLGRWDEALAEGRKAIALAEVVRDASLLARVKTRVGYVLRNIPNLEEAEPLLRQALQHAEAANDPQLLPRPLYHLGAIAWGRGRLAEAETHWTRALDISRTAGVRRAEGMAHNGMGILHICRGETAEARQELETAADIFRDEGMIAYVAIAQVNLIELYLSVGMIRRAAQLIERTLQQAREVGHSHGVSLGLVWRARMLIVLGRPDEARSVADEAMRIAGEIGAVDEQVTALMTRVEAMIAMGRASDALAHVETLLDLLGSADTEGVTPHVIALLVQVLVARGDMTRASVMLGTVDEHPATPHIAVRADLDIAAAASLIGDQDAATARLLRALEVSERHGYRFYELLALNQLTRLGADPNGAFARRATSLARTLAANLNRSDAVTFLARGWGQPRPAEAASSEQPMP